eukprot:TRINITY_DN8721_c0_g1_i1.p1 TRINITY_DN8721_c0_g1~~TRINITY_DN8721_c0_g1_i1.p1  ORF type:complete len:132 (+),score=27.10 TRINITY_DN8721_c0_g1_i1:49-396(+)
MDDNNGWQVKDYDTPPPPRQLHTSVCPHHSMMIFGGFGEGSQFLNDMWFLDPQNFTWRQQVITKNIEPRHSHAAVLYKNRIYVYGGVCSAGTLGDLCYFDIEGGKAWTTIKNGRR